MFPGEGHHFIVVDLLVVRIDAVSDDLVILAGAVGRGTMRQVTAMEQVHAHDRVTGLDQGVVNGIDGGCTRKRLHIDVDLPGFDVVGGKGLSATTFGQRLQDIGILGAFVETRVRVTAEVRQTGRVIQDLLLG